jgi:hypothetical protein
LHGSVATVGSSTRHDATAHGMFSIHGILAIVISA